MASESLKLSVVLEIHLAYTSFSKLNKNLCDGYLYATNPSYKNVRDTIDYLGCKFTQKDFCHYVVPSQANDVSLGVTKPLRQL
jgi:hypothetical protein